MTEAEVSLVNKLGLHARPSAKVSQLASSFKCDVWLTRGSRKINAKSIMGVMMLAAGLGAEIEIECDGADEQQAMEAIVALINDKFGEGR